MSESAIGSVGTSRRRFLAGSGSLALSLSLNYAPTSAASVAAISTGW